MGDVDDAMAYMPAIALSIAFRTPVWRKQVRIRPTSFPPVRVFGTIGFYCCDVDGGPDGAGTEQCAIIHRFWRIVIAGPVSLTLPKIPVAEEGEHHACQ